MNNLLLWLLFALINFLLIAAVYKLFGKHGLMCYIVMSVIAANIQVNKSVIFDFNLFSLETTLGNIMFSGIFLATDLLTEKYGAKVGKRSVYLSIFANITFIIIMFLATQFNGVSYTENFNQALDLFFGINGGVLKAVVIGNVVYLISQTLDVFVYARIKKWNESTKYLWLRNNGSTFLSQFVDTLLVTFGFALVGIFPMEIVWSVFIATLTIKYLAAAIDTPFLYIMNRIKPISEQ